MAFEVGTHTEKARTYPLVVGSAVLVPRALNPTKDQLAEMGIEVTEEPKYLITGKDSGKDWRIVSIWLGNTSNVLTLKQDKVEQMEVLAELRFLLKVEPGDLYINNLGRFAGAGKKDKLGASARLEHQNEHKLINFLKAFGRVAYEKMCMLENIDALINKGDTTEISQMLGACVDAGHSVRVVLGVENGNQQRVCTEAFAMDNASSLTYFHADLAKQIEYAGDAFYGPIFSDSSTLQVQNAVKLRVYNEQEALEYDDKKTAIKNAKGTFIPAGVSAGGNTAPPASVEEEMYTAPGRTFGGPMANSVSQAQGNGAPYQNNTPPPIGNDDDNDLPF